MDVSRLEAVLGIMYGVFMENAGPDGKLSKAAFLALTKKELPHFASVRTSLKHCLVIVFMTGKFCLKLYSNPC